MDEEKQMQVAKQCEAVAHLATALAQVSTDYAKMFKACPVGHLVEQVGQRTAHQMEVLGDILNGMDAITDKDKWLDPIFAEAQRLWPAPPAQMAASQECRLQKT